MHGRRCLEYPTKLFLLRILKILKFLKFRIFQTRNVFFFRKRMEKYESSSDFVIFFQLIITWDVKTRKQWYYHKLFLMAVYYVTLPIFKASRSGMARYQCVLTMRLEMIHSLHCVIRASWSRLLFLVCFRGNRWLTNCLSWTLVFSTARSIRCISSHQKTSKMPSLVLKTNCESSRFWHTLDLFFFFRFRKRLVRLISHSCFDYLILMFILANCAAMALERPTLPADGPVSVAACFVCCFHTSF